VIVIRLEDGDRVPECIERFAAENGVAVGHVILVGGIRSGQVVVGPRDSEAMPPDPMVLPVDGTHEILGVGVLAPDGEGKPILHMHAALGRSGTTLSGCVRMGVETWVMCEAILYEIVEADAVRRVDPATGFTMLQTGGGSSTGG
jgi:predicted DNA-binding protein with PD1-like motif